jgi:nucleotide-binding universal stress UspA family protein
VNLRSEATRLNLQKILFSTDFSHCGDEAFDLAMTLARDTGARLLIVHVEEPSNVYGGHEASYYGPPEPRREDLIQLLGKLVPDDPKLKFDHELLTGDPARAIVACAEKEDVDMIVLGTHGRTGMSHTIMGSVAEAVVRHAKCPVVTLKHSIHKSAGTN